jgi:hypothetical protein
MTIHFHELQGSLGHGTGRVGVAHYFRLFVQKKWDIRI